MQRHGKPYTPDLLKGTPRSGTTAIEMSTTAPQHYYAVTTDYVRVTGTLGSHTGTFLAPNSAAAEEQAREFVLRYLRPQQITGALTKPA